MNEVMDEWMVSLHQGEMQTSPVLSLSHGFMHQRDSLRGQKSFITIQFGSSWFRAERLDMPNWPTW